MRLDHGSRHCPMRWRHTRSLRQLVGEFRACGAWTRGKVHRASCRAVLQPCRNLCIKGRKACFPKCHIGYMEPSAKAAFRQQCQSALADVEGVHALAPGPTKPSLALCCARAVPNRFQNESWQREGKTFEPCGIPGLWNCRSLSLSWMTQIKPMRIPAGCTGMKPPQREST